jgi:hypothetical protein
MHKKLQLKFEYKEDEETSSDKENNIILPTTLIQHIN